VGICGPQGPFALWTSRRQPRVIGICVRLFRLHVPTPKGRCHDYIGIDVHSKTSTAVAVDQKGKILAKDQFPTTDGHLLRFVSDIPGKKALAVEETNLAQWVYLLLHDKVEDLAIAHPAHLKKQHGAKTDFVDAVRLAEELRLGTITRVHHEDTPLWNLRVLVQAYLDVTEDLVRAKNRYKALLRTLRLPSTGAAVYTEADLLKQI